MDDGRVGTALRAIRQRRGWRQIDLASAARVSRGMVSRIERGHLDELTVAALERVCRALDASLDIRIRWRGGDLARLVNARHAAMHEAVARLLRGQHGWVFAPEVSFSIFGERGVIDILTWQSTRRALLVVELKSEIVDVNDLVGSVDRKRRLALRVASERGWTADRVAAWVIVADSTVNRRRIAEHSTMLRAAFPNDGHQARAWLAEPSGTIAALSFIANAHQAGLESSFAPRKRVRRRSAARKVVNPRS